MRIYIVARGYPTKRFKTNGIFEFDQAIALKKRGHEVVFLVLDLRSIRRKRKWGNESKKVEGIFIEALNLPLGRIPNKWLYILGEIGLKKLYKRCVHKYGKPDVIHSHFADISYITNMALSKEKSVKVITEHASVIHNDLVKNSDKIRYKRAYHMADEVIAVSSSLASVMFNEYQIKCKVIPNIVNITELGIKNTFTLAQNSKTKYAFVSVGRLTKEKGMIHLVESFVSCFNMDEDVQLIIVGDGVEKKCLEEIIRRNKREKQIILLGTKSRCEIAEILCKSDCFVLPSESETFGVVYAEAMVFGIPVIGTRCGGPEDFIDSESGILVDVNDESELKEALLFMKANSNKLYNKEIIKNRIKNICSEEIIGAQLENLYKELLEKRSLS